MAQVRSMILLYWQTLFHLLPYYLGSITRSDNKAVKQSYHCTPTVHTLQHLPSSHLSVFPLRFLPRRLESGNLLHFQALRVLHMLNSPLRQTAEPVCVCVSWALTLFFGLSWRQLPWGSSSHGSTREALEPGPTHHIYCICLSLSQLEASVARSCGSRQWDCSCLTPCVLYLYPSFGGIPTVNSWHLTQAADLKKKTRSTPKHSCKHVYVQNPTAYPKQATFYHTTMILSWRHFYVIFISPYSYPSAGSPHPGGLSLTEREILLNLWKGY